jgi:GNAT superfamily N-acetyltransferase
MITVLAMTPDDWERVRRLRLVALADSPDVFSSTLAREEAFGEESWRARLSGPTQFTAEAGQRNVWLDMSAPNQAVTFIAESAGEDVGMATALVVDEPDTALVVGVWVSPAARGQGVAPQLFGEMFAWARDRGLTRVTLDVGDANATAQKLYANLGFRPTGKTGSLPEPRTHILEHELELHM